MRRSEIRRRQRRAARIEMIGELLCVFGIAAVGVLGLFVAALMSV